MLTVRKVSIIILIILIVFLVGCTKSNTITYTSGDNTGTIVQQTSDQTQQENQNNPEDSKQYGYLLKNQSQAAFIQLTEANKELSGQLQIVQFSGKKLSPESAAHAFKGILNDKGISITFSGNILTDSYSGITWTGTLSNEKLSLVIPSKSGTLNTIVFNKDTVQNFNKAVLELQQNAS